VGKKMGMQPEKPLAAAQNATWWAQKFALLCTFLASQAEEAGSDASVAAMTELICQSCERAGVFNAAMTTDESPSKEKVLRSRETAREAAS
jgi:hypothetical protein